MQAAALQGRNYAPLPRGRRKLQASLDRLGAAMDARRAAQLADVCEMRSWLAARVFSGADAPPERAWWLGPARLVEREVDPRARRDFCAMLLAVAERAGLELLHPAHAEREIDTQRALREMFRRRSDWARGPGDWRPECEHGKRHLLISLARHLFVRWSMPGFMDDVWVEPGRRARMARDLYAHMAAGRSLRTAVLPYRLTKRQAHFFPQARLGSTLDSALAFADARVHGLHPLLASSIAFHGLGQGLLSAPHQRDYWLSVLRYLAEHPRFADRHNGEVVDYLRGRIDGGRHAPLRLHGRDPAWLLGEVRGWHRELSSMTLSHEAARQEFPAGEIGGFRCADEPVDGADSGYGWRIRRLRNALELHEEGRALGHCVFTYAKQCMRGECSIWSLVRTEPEGTERRSATIRVMNQRVVEAKGLANRLLDREERAVVARWMTQENLQGGF